MKILSVSAVLGLAIAILGLAMAIFNKKLIDEILPERNIEALFIGIVTVAFLLFIKSGLSALRSSLIIDQSRQFNIRATGSFLNRLLFLPKPFFDTRKVGDFVARLNDTSRIQRVISQLIGSTIIDFIIALVTIGFLFFFSWKIALIAILGLGIYFIILYRSNNEIISTQKAVMSNYASNESQYIDTIRGITDIKSYHKYNDFLEANKLVFGQFQESIFNLGKINIKLSLLAGIVSTLILLSILSLGSVQVIHEEMELGSLIAIMGVTINLIASVANLAMVSIPLNEAMVAFNRMFAFSSFPQVQKDQNIKLNSIDFIEMNELSFSYKGRATLLRNISLELRKGILFTLIGESGNGKSTLLQILHKFYQNSGGNIIVNGIHNLHEISTSFWNKKVSYIPQNVHIFNGSVLHNITLTNNKRDWEKAVEFCDEIGLGDLIAGFPQGFETVVGDGGINLSGGQKQLIALARALYHKPQVLLLDEATAAMDRNTENFVLNLLHELKKELIIFIVTHQMKVASKSDYIYVLEKNMIGSAGTPESLLLTDNFYSKGVNELISI